MDWARRRRSSEVVLGLICFTTAMSDSLMLRTKSWSRSEKNTLEHLNRRHVPMAQLADQEHGSGGVNGKNAAPWRGHRYHPGGCYP